MFLSIPTSIELKLLHELRKREIEFEFQYPVLGGFVVDFAFPKSRLIVECDGDYWHANPKKYSAEDMNRMQKRNVLVDKRRQKVIEVDGWKVLRFWEHEINDDIKTVADKIEKNLVNND